MLEKNTQLKNIAISSYFLIGISGLMLLVKNNPNFSNKFVKSHIKVAFLIHLFIILVIIFLLFLGYFNFFQIYNFNSNQIIASFLLLISFFALLYGMYKANLGETMSLKEYNIKNKKNKIVELQDNVKVTEKGIFTIILAYIPFLGFLLSGKIKTGTFLNIIKLNTFFTIFLIFLYIFGYSSTGNFLLLIYIIFIVFIGIMLILNKSFIKVNLSFLPTFKEINNYIKIFFLYIKNYFQKNFIEFSKLKKDFLEKKQENELKQLKKLENKKDLKIPNKLIYIPILNIFFIFFLNTKYKNHIINGLFLSIFTIIFYLLGVNKYYYLFIIFGIFYGIGNLKKFNYKFPFLFDLYIFLTKIFEKIKQIFGIIKEKKETIKEVSYKVEDFKKDLEKK